jgi:tetratricopeptide (TPR) repeat protein
MSLDLGERREEANACLMLGHTFRQLKQHEKAVESYQKALTINKELKENAVQDVCFEKVQEGSINEWCGHCCRCIAGKHEEAIAFYKKAKEIAKQFGKKYQQYRANKAIGNILCNTGNYEKAKKYYQEALENAIELRDKHCEGKSYLYLASVSSKDCEYEMAIKWYENVLDIFGTELNDHPLKEKALIGLGIAWFNLGNTQKATESIRNARKFAKEETVKGNYF